MTLRDNIRAEFDRTPLTVMATVTGVVVATLALLVGWLQNTGQPVSPVVGPVGTSASGEIQLSNLLVVIAFFLAASFSIASLVRMIERAHRFAAMVLSVPAAVAVGFMTLLVFKLSPPRPLTDDLLQVAQDVVFWGTLFVFVAIGGASTARDFTEPKARPSPDIPTSGEKSQQDGLGILFGLLIMLAIWGSLVSTGLAKLTKLFLA